MSFLLPAPLLFRSFYDGTYLFVDSNTKPSAVCIVQYTPCGSLRQGPGKAIHQPAQSEKQPSRYTHHRRKRALLQTQQSKHADGLKTIFWKEDFLPYIILEKRGVLTTSLADIQIPICCKSCTFVVFWLCVHCNLDYPHHQCTVWVWWSPVEQ